MKTDRETERMRDEKELESESRKRAREREGIERESLIKGREEMRVQKKCMCGCVWERESERE